MSTRPRRKTSPPASAFLERVGVPASEPAELLEISFGMTLPPIQVALGDDAMDLRLTSESPAMDRALEGFES